MKRKYIVMSIIALLLMTFATQSAATAADIDDGTPTELVCLAKNIYFEAGNQPLAGKIAVAQVVLNRVDHKTYPNDICGVVYQARWRENWKGNMIPVRNMCQFSWYCDGLSDNPEDSKTWIKSLDIAFDILNNTYGDITEGATHYHSIMVEPYWASSLNETVQISDHIFYK